MRRLKAATIRISFPFSLRYPHHTTRFVLCQNKLMTFCGTQQENINVKIAQSLTGPRGGVGAAVPRARRTNRQLPVLRRSSATDRWNASGRRSKPGFMVVAGYPFLLFQIGGGVICFSGRFPP